MMRVIRTALATLAIVTVPLAAMAEEHPHKPVNLSLFYPIATSQDPTISTSFRLNLTYSHVGEIRGVDLNGLVSRVDRDVRWVQLTGLASYAGGNVSALQLTGAMNYVSGHTKGVQVAGLVNYDRGSFKGGQYAFLMNYTEEGFRGVQLTSVLNQNSGDGSFLQLATLANVTGGDFVGLQISTGVNFTDDEFEGVQFGQVNFATDVRGVQIGLFNAVRYANGPQIGALNIARENNSVPVGLMSFAENGTADWISYGSSYVAFSTGVRTTVNGFYSMLAAGVGDITAEEGGGDTAFLEWNYGYAFDLGQSKKWSIAPDLGYMHIMPQPSAPNPNQQFGLMARLLAEVRFNERVSVFAGGGVVMRFSEYSTEASSTTDGLGLLGISLF